MDIYLDTLRRVARNGSRCDHRRTKSQMRKRFGEQMEFDLSYGMPLLSERKILWQAPIKELLWFLRGETNTRTLDAKIWDEWALTAKDMCRSRAGGRASKYDVNGKLLRVGDCGPIYGRMWRAWPCSDGSTIDQIAQLDDQLRRDPHSRRLIVSGWNPELTPDETLSPQDNIYQGKQCLPPCHTLFQLGVEEATLTQRIHFLFHPEKDRTELPQLARELFEDLEAIFRKKTRWILRQAKRDAIWESIEDHLSDHERTQAAAILSKLNVPTQLLHLKLTARSQDLPLGTVFNVFQYAVLLRLIAHHRGFIPGRYIHSMGDAHIYENQMPGVDELLKRPRSDDIVGLRIKCRRENLWDYELEDFEITGYSPQAVIRFPIAI